MDIASRRFAWLYTLSQLKLKYRYTTLGFLWNFLEPAMFLIVLSAVFSVVNRMNISDYAVFLFSALVPWRYFEKVVNTSMDSIVGGDWLLKKMYASPFVFPLTRWLTASIEFLFSFTVMFVIFGFIKNTWSYHILILPLAIIPWAILGLGTGLIAAVLFTFFRDIRPIVQMMLMLAFFTSPILFRADVFDEHLSQATLMKLHPVSYFAALFQKPLYFSQWPGQLDWLVTIVVSTISLAVGWHLMNRYKDRFYFYL